MNRLRVLHIIPDIGISNGVMSVILNYMSHMPPDIQFDVAYFVDTVSDRRTELNKLGAQVFRIPAPNAKAFLKSADELFAPADISNYDILHLHLPYLASVYATKAKMMGITKVFVHCHSTWYSLDPHHSLRNRILNIPTHNLADLQIACGDDAGKFWYKKDYINLPNSIDIDKYRFDPAAREVIRTQMNLNASFVVGHVGRVSPPQKNHTFILNVFAEVLKHNSNSVLLLVGAEPDKDLTELANGLNIERQIRFLGQRTDIPQLLSAMDAFLFPSLYEGLPVALIEAQAAGLMCFASSVITKEVQVLDNVQFLSLDIPASEWAKHVVQAAAYYNREVQSQFEKSKWNIRNSSEILAGYYKQ